MLQMVVYDNHWYKGNRVWDHICQNISASASCIEFQTVLAELCKPNASIVLDDLSASINKFGKWWG